MLNEDSATPEETPRVKVRRNKFVFICYGPVTINNYGREPITPDQRGEEKSDKNNNSPPAAGGEGSDVRAGIRRPAVVGGKLG